MTGAIIAGAIGLFVAIILARAALIKAPEASFSRRNWPAYSPSAAVNTQEAAKRLAGMVRCRTVIPEGGTANAEQDGKDYSEYKKFRSLLPEYYPQTHRKLELEIIDGQSLLYRWPGENRAKPMVLMAHYDVVPAADEQWTHPPFGGVIENGVIWGRGTLDTKGTLCAILEAVEGLVREGFQPENDIYLFFGHNEEVFGTGAVYAVELLKSRGVQPEIVLDEGGAIMNGMLPGIKNPVALIGTAEKGFANFEFSVSGSGGHASAPGRNNPVSLISKIILALDRKPFKAHLPGEIDEMFTILGPHMPFAMRIIFSNMWCFKPLLRRLLPLIGREMNAFCRTTSVATIIEGGSAPNVIPNLVKVVANVRPSARDSLQFIGKQLKEQTLAASVKERKGEDSFKVDVKMLYGHEASPSSDTASPAYNKLRQTISECFPGVLVTPYIMLGGTDSRHFCKISENVFRFLPFEMSKEELRTIHGVDERIGVEKLGGTIEFYRRLIAKS